MPFFFSAEVERREVGDENCLMNWCVCVCTAHACMHVPHVLDSDTSHLQLHEPVFENSAQKNFGFDSFRTFLCVVGVLGDLDRDLINVLRLDVSSCVKTDISSGVRLKIKNLSIQTHTYFSAHLSSECHIFVRVV